MTATEVLLSRIWIFVVLGTGIPGNLYCCREYLTDARLRRRSSCHFLAALALADVTFLISLSTISLRTFGISLDTAIPGVCQIHHYMSYAGALLSAWYIAAYGVDRVLALRNPSALAVRSTAEIRRTRLVILGMSVAGLLYCLWVPFFTGLVQHPRNVTAPDGSIQLQNVTECDIYPYLDHMYVQVTTIDTLVSFLIPFCIIITTHTYITVHVCLTRRQTYLMAVSSNRNVMSSSRSGTAPSHVVQRSSSRSSSRANGNVAHGNGQAVGSGYIETVGYQQSGQYGGCHANGGYVRYVATGAREQNASTRSVQSWSDQKQSIRLYKRVAKLERSLTVLLLSIAFLYVALNLPAHVYRILVEYKYVNSIPQASAMHIYGVSYTPYAFNCWAFAIFTQQWRCVQRARDRDTENQG